MPTTRASWDRFRSLWFHDDDLGISVDVSRMGAIDKALGAEKTKLAAAFDAMEALESGAVANPSEGRQVGHYWLRAPELAPDAKIGAEIRANLERIEAFAAAIASGATHPSHADRFEHLLVVGIGGSALGPQLVADALGTPEGPPAPYFFDNTDPDGLDRVLARIGRGLARTLTIVISKSGGTPETRNGMHEAAAAYRAMGLDFGRHAVAVTQEGSQLDRTARSEAFVERFPMWDWVGGRTSVCSAVGLLPAALQRIDVRAFLAGAARMDQLTRVRDARANPAALLALSWYHAGGGVGSRAMVVLPYKDRLVLFSRYLQQLVMESLGKEQDQDGNVVHQGLTVFGNKGSTDQHAYVQQLRDGRDDFFATFVRVLHGRDGESIEVSPGATSADYLDGFLLGTREALFDSSRPSLTVTLAALDARRLGALIALYERAVGLYASLVRVNAYDQPGVEAGKQAAAAILATQAAILAKLHERPGDEATCDQIAAAIDRAEQAEIVFHILERLALDPRRGIVKRSGSTPFDATYRILSL